MLQTQPVSPVPTWKNKLYFGDNLLILPDLPSEYVDLVYLDPPFNSQATYNVLFREKTGELSTAQITAFEDTWHWGVESEAVYHETVSKGGKLAELLQAYRSFLGQSDMMAYLTMMAPRLAQLHRVLKPTGSIYLHCDPTASHFLKLLLDAIFSPQNFMNEIIWRRTGSHNSSKRYGPIHDVILFYSKTDEPYFKKVFQPYLKGHVEGYFKQSDERGQFWTNALTGSGTRRGESGQPWHGYDPTTAGRHWAIPGRIAEELGLDDDLNVQEKLDALDEAGFIGHPSGDSSAMPTYKQYLKDSPGMPLQDIWAYQPHTSGALYGTDEGIDEDVRWLVKQGDSERLPYPTQKPLGLLNRIIKSSCPQDGIVLDPFCGCGTTIVSAERIGLKWIGIDVTQLAIALIDRRLHDTFRSELSPYDVIGVPTTLSESKALAAQNRYQFEWWAVYKVGAYPAQDKKKGADTGIDGYILFFDDKSGKAKKIVIQVKSGHVSVKDVRELAAVADREKAPIGVLVTLENPTDPMKKESLAVGFYEPKYLPGKKFHRLQILTIQEIFAGKEIQYPRIAPDVTFRKAARTYKAKAAEQTPLSLPQDHIEE